ncbi:hypothetical protein GCM10027360_07340 [Amycolatopsis echigonensis]|nr:hypothetical protein GCM10017788_50410 [Amycolatopsis acidiphila]
MQFGPSHGAGTDVVGGGVPPSGPHSGIKAPGKHDTGGCDGGTSGVLGRPDGFGG